MTHHQVKQNTDEPCPCCGKTWMELRAGKVTGSSIGKVMANYGKAFGDPAKKIAIDIAVHELGGSPTVNEYNNAHMERGHLEEPIARELYEIDQFVDVQLGGFFEDGWLGCSPDGLVRKNGVIEIKSVTNAPHYACIKRNSYDTDYKWQLIFNTWISKRLWIDFVSYCGTFTENRKLFIHRININDVDEDVKKIKKRLSEFRSLIDEIKYNITI